jgi:hypothetical protein
MYTSSRIKEKRKRPPVRVAFILIGKTQIEKYNPPKNGQEQQQPLLSKMKKKENLHQPVLHSNLITTRMR